jgi:positive regulator of sigma E activity
MFSGAAGLIAGFAAISLVFLFLEGAAVGAQSLSRTITIVAVALVLGSVAAFLLRFSLTRIDPASSLHSHTLPTSMRLRH